MKKHFLSISMLLISGCQCSDRSVVARHPMPTVSQPIVQPTVPVPSSQNILPVPQPVIVQQQDPSMPAWMMFHLLNNTHREPTKIVERHHTVYHAPVVVKPSPVYKKPVYNSSPGRYSSGGSYSRPVSKPSGGGGRYSSGGRR